MRFRDLIGGRKSVPKSLAGGKYTTALMAQSARDNVTRGLPDQYEPLASNDLPRPRTEKFSLEELCALSSKQLRAVKRQLALELHPDRFGKGDRRSNEKRLATFNSEIDRILAKRQCRA